MPRAKIGDVYAVKVPKGYKLIQWAYHMERYGRFIRVFDGLYDAIPENIAEIVAGEHSYVTDLFVGRAYRIGLLQWLGNFPVPERYPVPEYRLEFNRDQYGKIYQIKIENTPACTEGRFSKAFPVSGVEQLPAEFRNVKLLSDCVSPDWLLYLFDNGFSLREPDIFNPWIHWGENWEEQYQVYIDTVNTLWDADKAKRNRKSKP